MTMTAPGNVLDQAAEWFAILRNEGVTAEDRARWRTWFDASPQHADAWRRVEAIGGTFAEVRAAAPAPVARDALARAATASRRRTLRLLGFGGLLFGTGVVARQTLPWVQWPYQVAAGMADEKTRVGEIRSLMLEDGTQLVLNTATAVNIDYGKELRRIVLRDGEILITTAKDPHQPARPLVVDTVQGRLTALGTRFSVRSGQRESAVAVYAGTVRVAPADSTVVRDVTSGSQASFTRDGISPLAIADPAREGWSRGQLIADDIRLDRFIAELARYTDIRFEVAADAAGQRLVGVYSIADPLRDMPRILIALEGALPVRVRRVGDDTLRIEAR